MKLVDKMVPVLGFPAAYRLFSTLVSGDVWMTYISEYVRPVPGEKVLDIGCGPGDILMKLPDVNYTGIDISEDYIEAARKRFGVRGRFCCGDVGTATIDGEKGTFNLAIATGVLHHLDDERAGKLFELATMALKPGGRLVTYDGCYVNGQSPLARWFLDHDRGKFVRRREEYVRLASAHFPQVESYLRDDLLRIPYTHLITRCFKQA